MSNNTERELGRIRKALERIADALEPEVKVIPDPTFGEPKRLVEVPAETNSDLYGRIMEGHLAYGTAAVEYEEKRRNLSPNPGTA